MSTRKEFRKRPVVLCVLDGWGYRKQQEDNAVALGKTPNFDRYWSTAPRCFLHTDGHYVGLPDGQFGNSEVGHMNLGAGRVVMQEFPRIDQALEDGSLAQSEVLARIVQRVKDGSGRVHLLGLMSTGGVHSHQRHVFGLMKILSDEGLEIVVHAITDGRDTSPHSGKGSIGKLLETIGELPRTSLGTICGRYFIMDRDKRWERTEQGYRAVVEGHAEHKSRDAIETIQEFYENGTTDEFLPAVVMEGYAGMGEGDGLICCNFRADRVRQILGAIVDPEFDGFDVHPPKLSAAAGMTSYSSRLDEWLDVLFPPQDLHEICGEIVAKSGLKQLRAAETEKYPHVTFFFNGGEERQYEGEARILVPSPKVATYDLQPEMSAPELTEKFLAALRNDTPDFALINFANPDMVGHTGVLDAAIKAVETVDHCLGRIVEEVLSQEGAIIVTADHGNCETMRDPETGEAHTQHTTNLVYCILLGAGDGLTLHEGKLADIAPTLLHLLGVEQPVAMTGSSLIQN